MRKLLCFCLLFVTMTKLTFAQDYYVPATDKNLYGNHFYISLQDADNVRLDADAASQYVIAGYIGDECRATAEFVRTPGNTYVAVLKVNGESDDAGKDIKFRIYNNVSKIEYELTDTYKFTGDDATIGTPSSPLLFTIIPVIGLAVSGLDSDGKISVNRGETKNLSGLVSTVPANHTPIINSNITYDASASAEWISVDSSTGILKGLNATDSTPLTIRLVNTKSGQQTTVTSECTVRVIRVYFPVTSMEVTPITVGLNNPTALEIKYQPDNATFDPSRLSITVTEKLPDASAYPESWETVRYLSNGSIVGRTLGKFSIKVTFVPEESTDTITATSTVWVVPEYNFTKGWNWFSIYVSDDEAYDLIAYHDNFTEARSETQLVYNDPEVGLFGDLTKFEPGHGYKMKVSDNVEGLLFNMDNYWSYHETEQTIHKYWNWIGTPYQYDYRLSNGILGDFSPEYGDRIVGLDGFAEYVEGDSTSFDHWTGSLAVLKAGHAYLLYTTSDDTSFEWRDPSGLFQPSNAEISEARQRDEANVWSYDKHAFLNNMSIVAVSDCDVEANPDNYSIGAFVGDVCRGEGKFVDGRWFITVHGENKETVGFRLYNKTTGEITKLDKTLRFSIGAGTVVDPVEIESGTITSISDVNTSSETICFGNGEIFFSSDADDTVAVYDLSGRVVITQSAASGSVDVGNLPSGTYIVRVQTASGTVSKKFRK